MNAHVARLDDVCEINPRAPRDLPDDELATFLPMAAVSEDGHIQFEERREAGDVKKGYTYFERGDVLVAKITPCFENGKATRTVELGNRIGFASTEFHVLRAGTSIDESYLFHMIWNSRFREVGSRNMTGSAGQKRVPVDFLKRLEIPLPPLDEQRRIAAILDKADALRRKRKRAIELLDGLTQSIFAKTFRDSVDHQTTTIGSVCEVSSGSTPRRDEQANFGGNIPWVKTTEVRGDRISDTEERITEAGRKSARLKIFPKGTLLIAMYGQGATRGKVAVLGIDATVNQACAALIPGPRIDSTFLFHQLRLSYERLRDLGRGGNQPNLNGQLVKNFEIFVPPIERQLQFVGVVNEIESQIRTIALSTETTNALFSSLQSRAFSGQL